MKYLIKMFVIHTPLYLSLIIIATLAAIHFSGYNLAYIDLKHFPRSQKINGTITKITDGDTLIVRADKQNLKIRLYGIDAPESKQAYGKQAKIFLEKACPIHSKASIIVKDKDKYNRIVGIVFCQSIDVNESLVRNGLAWSYDEFSFAYKHFEFIANIKKRGLWQDKNRLRPSEFRKQQSQVKGVKQ